MHQFSLIMQDQDYSATITIDATFQRADSFFEAIYNGNLDMHRL
jgi:hypothetical protein